MHGAKDGLRFSIKFERVAQVDDDDVLPGVQASLQFLGSDARDLQFPQNRRRFLRKLKIARITPEELKRRLDAREDVVIVDLRHSLEFDAEPQTIFGAVHMDPADLEEAIEVIPRDREIVLFCSCPNEATAAQMALRLRSRGITRIRPLAEGLEGWRKRGFPLQVPNQAVEAS